MAIRDDNAPPSNLRGSITQTADAQQDRIGNISNVSKTVSNMQKDVKQRITETKQMVDDSEGISAVQSSMVKVLDKLQDTVSALSTGVKTVTIDTAKATKDAIGDYSKAISQDISFNKQSVVAMALAKSTPIYGYFVAKFMETDVFKRAAERMKTSIGKAFGSLAGIFRRDGKKPSNDQLTRQVKGKIPHMAKGGVVGKEGVAKLHAAEVVMPVEKLLERMDESTSVAKNIGKIVAKMTMQQAATSKAMSSMIQHPDEGMFGKDKKTGMVKSFFKILREEKERYKDPIEVRQLRELIAIREEFGAEMKIWPEVWSRMIEKHPVFRNAVILGKGYIKLLALTTWKPVYALFKTRGGYGRYLSRAAEPLKALNQNSGLMFVESMWRYDNMLNLLKAIATATRDTASTITGKKYPSLKGIGTGTWSIAGVTARLAGALTGGAMRLAGKIPGLGGVGKLGKKLTGLAGTWEGQREYALGSAGGKEAKGPNKLYEAADIYVKKNKLEVKAMPIAKKIKKDKQLFEMAEERTKLTKKVNKSLKDKKWVQWILMGWGFLKGMISKFWKNTIGRYLNKKVLGGLLSGAGGFAKGGFKLPMGMGPKLAGAGGIAAGVALGVYEAFQAVKLADKWGTSKTSAGIGGFLGGTGAGVEGAMMGMGKGGMIGAGAGMFFGPLGAAIGGGIGALAGGILGFVGGKRIATGLDWLGAKIKKVVLAMKKLIMIPIHAIQGMWEKFKETGFFKTVAKITTWYVERVKSQFKLLISVITWPFKKVWELNMKLRDWTLDKISSVWDWVKDKTGNIFGSIGGWFGDKINSVWDWVKTKADEIFTFENAWSVISTILSLPFKLLKGIAKGIFSLTKTVIGKENIQKIKDIISNPIDSVIGVFKWIGDLFIKIKDKIVGGISKIPGAGWFMDEKDKKGPSAVDKAKQKGKSWWNTAKSWWSSDEPKKIAQQAKAGITTAAIDKINSPEMAQLAKMGKETYAQTVGSVKDRYAAMIDKGNIVVTEANLMLASGEMIAEDLGKKILESSKAIGEKTMQGANAMANTVQTVTTNISQSQNTTNSGGGNKFDPSSYFDQMVFQGNYR